MSEDARPVGGPLGEATTAPRLAVQGARRGVDVPLLVIVGALLLIGLPMILSAKVGDASVLVRQLAGIGIGASLAAAAYFLPDASFRRVVPGVYVATLALQVLPFTPFGVEANGARRWIEVLGVGFQPSEVARVGLVLMLADYLARNRGRLGDVTGVAVTAFGVVLAPMLTMIPQKDLGSMAILFGLGAVMLYIAGLSWRILGPALLCGLIGAVPLVYAEGYRIERLWAFLDPFEVRDGTGYQVVEGWIAFASGQWLGVGYANGAHERLPAAHTDFIAAVIAEEWGATGFAVLVLLQWALLWRGTGIALRSRDLFGMLVAAGVTALFGAQAVINLGVIGGLVPNKGLVLPFVSYGGSAILVHGLCIGLLLRIAAQHEAPPATAAAWRPAVS